MRSGVCSGNEVTGVQPGVESHDGAVATRQHVLTSRAKRRSLWQRWFAWYPVVVSVEEEFDHWVWFEHLEKNGLLADMAIRRAIGGIGIRSSERSEPKASSHFSELISMRSNMT